MDVRIRRQLSSIDWNFIQGDESHSSAAHWYPGTFIPALPGALIEALTAVGQTVFDPYGGAGTTGLAALARGRRAVVVDANPVGILSAYCSLALLSLKATSVPAFERALSTMLEIVDLIAGRPNSLHLLDHRVAKDLDTRVCDFAGQKPSEFLSHLGVGAPILESLEPWFEQSTLQGIRRTLLELEENHSGTFIHALGLLMLSANVRRLSSQTRSWGHIADNVLPTSLEPKDVQRALHGWLLRLRNRYARTATVSIPGDVPHFMVRLADWQTGVENGLPRASLLVTSPPYAGAIDYVLAQRLSLHLLGYDATAMASLLRAEIGARRKRGSRGHVENWADTVARMAVIQSEVVEPGGHLVFVLPHKDSGRERGEIELERALAAAAWHLQFRADRSIRQARARQSWTSIKRESILIFG